MGSFMWARKTTISMHSTWPVLFPNVMNDRGMSFSLEVSLLHITIKHELLPIALGLRDDVIRLTSCTFFCTINNARRVSLMSESTYSISEISEVITRLPEQFDQDPKPV